MSGAGESYECAFCLKPRIKGRDDEEAFSEHMATWQPGFAAEPVEIVCDDCYRVLMEWAESAVPELLRPGRPDFSE